MTRPPETEKLLSSNLLWQATCRHLQMIFLNISSITQLINLVKVKVAIGKGRDQRDPLGRFREAVSISRQRPLLLEGEQFVGEPGKLTFRIRSKEWEENLWRNSILQLVSSCCLFFWLLLCCSLLRCPCHSCEWFPWPMLPGSCTCCEPANSSGFGSHLWFQRRRNWEEFYEKIIAWWKRIDGAVSFGFSCVHGVSLQQVYGELLWLTPCTELIWLAMNFQNWVTAHMLFSGQRSTKMGYMESPGKSIIEIS